VSSTPGQSVDVLAGTLVFEADDGRGAAVSVPGKVNLEPYVAGPEAACDPSWVVHVFSSGNGAPNVQLASEVEVVEGGTYEVDAFATILVPSGERYWLTGPEDCSVPEQGCSPRPARATLHVDELPADGLHAAVRITGRWCFGDYEARDGVCDDDVTMQVTATGELWGTSDGGQRQRDIVDRDPDGQPSPGVGYAGYLCLPN